LGGCDREERAIDLKYCLFFIFDEGEKRSVGGVYYGYCVIGNGDYFVVFLFWKEY